MLNSPKKAVRTQTRKRRRKRTRRRRRIRRRKRRRRSIQAVVLLLRVNPKLKKIRLLKACLALYTRLINWATR